MENAIGTQWRINSCGQVLVFASLSLVLTNEAKTAYFQYTRHTAMHSSSDAWTNSC